MQMCVLLSVQQVCSRMSGQRSAGAVCQTQGRSRQSMTAFRGRNSSASTNSGGKVSGGTSRQHHRQARLDVDDITRSFSSLSVTARRKPEKLHVPTVRQARRFSLGGKASLEDVCRALGHQQLRHVICLVGAGISTASGIPDFRSPGSGLYDNLQKYDIPYPEAIFDLTFFRRQPRPFLCLAKELYPGNYKPNLVHNFLCMLSEKGLLQRVYTQNIDGLERLAGVPGEQVVEAHGTFATASCLRCHRSQDRERVKQTIFGGKIPRCSHCEGLVKPDIVFFGENLPERFFRLQHSDFRLCDLLLVMGTSLEVEPFSGLVDMVKSTTPRVLINRDLVGPFRSKRKLSRAGPDLALQGDLVSGVQRFSELCGWSEHLQAAHEEFTSGWKCDSPDRKTENSIPESKTQLTGSSDRKTATYKHIAAVNSTASPDLQSSSSSSTGSDTSSSSSENISTESQ